MTFPRAPEEISDDWLTGRLHAAGVLDHSETITASSWEPIGESSGMAGAVVRIGIESSGPSVTGRSLVAKFSTTVEANLRVMLRYGLYRREVHFYRALAPSVPVAVPRCYGAEISDDGAACVLLLEDLRDRSPGDQVRGAGETDTRTCLTALARLHGEFWGDPERLSGVWRADGEQAEAKIASFPASWERARGQMGDRLASHVVDAMPRYIDALPRLHEWAARPPSTLVHGDMRLDNVMFAGDGSVSLVDWQNCQCANGLIDVAYFLTQSVDAEVRRRTERDLLAHYAQTLRASGAELDEDDLWEQYRAAALLTFSTAIVLAGLAGIGPRSAELADAVITRAMAAFDELDLLGLLDAPRG